MYSLPGTIILHVCTGDKKKLGIYRVPGYLGKLTTRGVQYGYYLYSHFISLWQLWCTDYSAVATTEFEF